MNDGEYTAEARAGGMRFCWRIEGDQLLATLSAPSKGWLAVGFNEAAGLSGARLVMASVVDGRGRIEEHSVEPPHHQIHPESSRRVRLLDATQSEKKTSVRFILKLERLRSSQSVELILAYSDSDDFEHHSRMREHQRILL